MNNKIFEAYIYPSLNFSKIRDYISLNKPNGPKGTYNGFNEDQPIEKRIDYIYLKNIDVLNHEHIDDRLENKNHISDHLPVIVDLIIKP